MEHEIKELKRVMTMKSTQRHMSGYARIKNMCEAIYLDKYVEKAKRTVAEHIAEAAAIAENILGTK